MNPYGEDFWRNIPLLLDYKRHDADDYDYYVCPACKNEFKTVELSHKVRFKLCPACEIETLTDLNA